MKTVLALLLSAVLCCPFSAVAIDNIPSGSSMSDILGGLPPHRISYDISNLIYLSVRDVSGEALPIYSRHGYPVAMGDSGKGFRLVFRNPLDERVKVVVSVDGLNPLTGRDAYLGDRGYVLDPGQSATIELISAHRKKKEVPLLFPSAEAGHGKISFVVFRERMDYPYKMPWSFYEGKPGYGTMLGSPRNYRWLPPSGAKFRMLSHDPAARIYLEYESIQGVVRGL